VITALSLSTQEERRLWVRRHQSALEAIERDRPKREFALLEAEFRAWQAREARRQQLEAVAQRPGRVQYRSVSASDVRPAERDVADIALRFVTRDLEFGAVRPTVLWFRLAVDDDRTAKARGAAFWLFDEREPGVNGFYQHASPGVLWVRADRSLKDIAETVAHEALHCWQHINNVSPNRQCTANDPRHSDACAYGAAVRAHLFGDEIAA
jgi:hypothetical protein